MRYIMVLVALTFGGCVSTAQLAAQAPDAVSCLSQCAGCVIELHSGNEDHRPTEHIDCAADCLDCCIEIMQGVSSAIEESDGSSE